MFGKRGDPSITKSPLKTAQHDATRLSSTRNYSKPWLSGRVSPVDTGVGSSTAQRGGSPRTEGGSRTDTLSKFTHNPHQAVHGRSSPRKQRVAAGGGRVTPMDFRRAIGLAAAGSTSLQSDDGGLRQGSLTIAALLGSGGRTSPRGGSSRLDHASMY